MNDEEIRINILETLYDYRKEHSNFMPPGLLKMVINVKDYELELNVEALRKGEYVQASPRMGELPDLKITSKGVDLLKNGGQFNSENLINIAPNSPGAIQGFNVSITASHSFNQVYKVINQKNPSDKDTILELVESIENELKKDSLNKPKIKAIYDWIQQNYQWLIPTLAPIMVKILLNK
ncbi:hypothetical protein FGU46_03370 [Methanobacterium sp. CWC-01]|uniref:hypothetical protein n=1 Tax=Methanobacterium aridiramus TaxID=2584467 RepID=UPI002575471C|nr:hypothetical protein [Methanobacterium sp. CWC-01]WJI09200.1 hypothetical protein FGU46_03370 [Methanobacterium sp. CWC-01]